MDEEKQKEHQELSKRLDELRASLKQKEQFIRDIRSFFEGEEVQMLVQ